MRILVLYTLPPDVVGSERTVWEFELSGAAAMIAKALRGAVVRAVRGNPYEILTVLQETKPDVIFNLCEAPLGRPDLEAHVACLFEWLGVRFTGCGSETLALCRRKDLTGAVLMAAGIPVPASIDAANPRFPCVVKPVSEDGSAGIHAHSLCYDTKQLEYALSACEGTPIVQEFVPGREFSVSLWGRSSPDYCSIGESTPGDGDQLITYKAKWDEEMDGVPTQAVAAELASGLEDEILRTARRTWTAVGARHALRLDIRLDEPGIPRVLDVNPNPAISPRMGICRAVQEAGWRWEEFVRKLVEWA